MRAYSRSRASTISDSIRTTSVRSAGSAATPARARPKARRPPVERGVEVIWAPAERHDGARNVAAVALAVDRGAGRGTAGAASTAERRVAGRHLDPAGLAGAAAIGSSSRCVNAAPAAGGSIGRSWASRSSASSIAACSRTTCGPCSSERSNPRLRIRASKVRKPVRAVDEVAQAAGLGEEPHLRRDHVVRRMRTEQAARDRRPAAPRAAHEDRRKRDRARRLDRSLRDPQQRPAQPGAEPHSR